VEFSYVDGEPSGGAIWLNENTREEFTFVAGQKEVTIRLKNYYKPRSCEKNYVEDQTQSELIPFHKTIRFSLSTYHLVNGNQKKLIRKNLVVMYEVDCIKWFMYNFKLNGL
jgi:hypothetical protein